MTWFMYSQLRSHWEHFCPKPCTITVKCLMHRIQPGIQHPLFEFSSIYWCPNIRCCSVSWKPTEIILSPFCDALNSLQDTSRPEAGLGHLETLVNSASEICGGQNAPHVLTSLQSTKLDNVAYKLIALMFSDEQWGVLAGKVPYSPFSLSSHEVIEKYWLNFITLKPKSWPFSLPRIRQILQFWALS